MKTPKEVIQAVQKALNSYEWPEDALAAAEEIIQLDRLEQIESQSSLQERVNRAYSERAYAAAALARMALLAGFEAGKAEDLSAGLEWKTVLMVDTPAGQVSWHIAEKDLWVLDGLPQYFRPWDGTFRSRDGSFAIWERNNSKQGRKKMESLEKLSFSTALVFLKEGRKVAREGWNGFGQWVAMQTPDEHSKMRRPYLYISPVGGDLVPWFASQSDLLAEDWYVVE